MFRLMTIPASLILVLATGSAALANESSAETDPGEQASYASDGAKTCLDCHDKPPATLILNTPHAQSGDSRTPFAAHDCETCHGASPEHVRKKEGETDRPPVAVQFGAESPTPVAEQNKVCMDCHEGGLRMNWQASPHHNSDVACASCHTVHANKDPVLVKTSQPDICFNCHVAQRAQYRLRSRHPIFEGKVVCSDCHNPHGSFGPKQIKAVSVNELCYGCHAEKRGPFLWEHAPVRDDCTTCHNPHGTTQVRLLKVRTPLLCQQCHLESFHPSTLYSGSSLPPPRGERIAAKGCLNCHSKIHGSNHPSGPRFTR